MLLGEVVFQKYVVMAHLLHFQPLGKGPNHWELREAIGGNGRTFSVWHQRLDLPHHRGDLCLTGMCFVFKHRDAAALEIERISSLGSKTQISRLFAVSAWGNGGAISAVVDQIYGGHGQGVEQLQ